MIRELIHYFKMKRRLRIYQEGSTISHFIARDVRRDVIVISNKEIEEGFVTVRIKTNNILYLKKGLQEPKPFGEPERVELSKLWEWTGRSWGGLPNGKSIGDEH